MGDGGPVHHVLVLVGRGGVRGVHVLVFVVIMVSLFPTPPTTPATTPARV